MGTTVLKGESPDPMWAKGSGASRRRSGRWPEVRRQELGLRDGTRRDEIPARGDLVIGDLTSDFDGFTVAFDIPADMTGGTLVVHPEGKMTAVWSDTEAGAKWSKKPKAGEFDIVFTTGWTRAKPAL